MKKFFSLVLAMVILTLMLTACTTPSSPLGGSGNKIDSDVVGEWYGPDTMPYLNILEDGTGTCAYLAKAVEAKFSTNENIFTADSTEYRLSGEYEVKDNRLYVKTEYENEIYTVIFTREKFTISEGLEGSHIYTIDDKAYELHLSLFSSYVKELPFPPSAEYSETEISITPGITEGNPSPETNETVTVTSSDLIIHKHPPVEFFYDKAYPDATTDATAAKGETATEGKTDTTAEATKVDNEKPENNDDLPVPERVYTEKDEVKVVVGGKTYTASKGGNSIVGTWTSAKQTGTSYIFGYVGEFDYTTTFTFNADGTGTVTALIFPGTLTWSLEGNRLDLTISMLGDTESGSAYITLLGDVMYLKNHKGELYALSRQ